MLTIESTMKRINDLNIVDIHIDGGKMDLENINAVLDCIEESNKKFGSIEDLKKRMGINV